MNISRRTISSGFIFTMISYGGSVGIRFLTNVLLARLLGPEILGVMVVAQAVRAGAELFGDLGFEQNVVHNKHGNEPNFLNTIWTMQIARGCLISLFCLAISPALAAIYDLPTEVFLVVSAAPMLNALASISVLSLSKNLQVKTRTTFELVVEGLSLVVNVLLALNYPGIWAPIAGVILTVALRSTLSYLLPHPALRLRLDREHVHAIFDFGKWIALSSLALYASLYLDRLFLGYLVPLATLGVYGLARTVSDLPVALAGRLGFQIVFPVISAGMKSDIAGAQANLAPIRRRYFLLCVVSIGTVMAWSDLAIGLVYDPRYHEAGWMLFLLLIGSWVSVVAAMNEAVVFGCGKPKIVSIANMVRIAAMVFGLLLGHALWGLEGAILGLTLGEIARYGTLGLAQRELGVGYFRQDGAFTLLLVLLVGAWMVVRIVLGLGTPLGMLS